LEHEESDSKTSFLRQYVRREIMVTFKIASIIVVLTHDICYETIVFQSYNFKNTKTFFFIRDAQDLGKNIEEIGRQKIEDRPPSEGVVTKTLSNCVDNINLDRDITIHKSSGAYILPQDSQVVKQDDKMNEEEEGIILFL